MGNLRETVMNPIEIVDGAIGSGASLTDAIQLGGLRLFAVALPSDAWTSASLTFQVSADQGSSWSNLYDVNGNEIVAQAAVGRVVALDPTVFAAFQYVRLRSGTAASPVAQASARVVKLMLRGV